MVFHPNPISTLFNLSEYILDRLSMSFLDKFKILIKITPFKKIIQKIKLNQTNQYYFQLNGTQ